MEQGELHDLIIRQRQPAHRFIKWWRREHDFLNFELLDQFLEGLDDQTVQMLEGFELLDTEEMWQELQHRAPEHVSREHRNSGDVILWDRETKEKSEVCPFNPDSIMTIFDVETRGNVID